MKRISETAFLVAMYRALETDRPDALFQDPLARILAGGQGAMHVEVLGDQERATTAIAIRTRVMDELIEQLIKSSGVDTVINLAAGLDTRPYRLSLPASLRWIEVDLPDILAYKEQKLQNQQPNCSLERIKLDLDDSAARHALLARINAETTQALVITEGLLGYMSELKVASLATALHHQPHLRWWLFEYIDPSLGQQSQNHYDQKIFNQYFTDGQPAFKFSSSEGIEFFEDYGWQISKFCSIWKEGQRLKRLEQSKRLTWLWVFLLRWLNRKIYSQSGIALLERVESAPIRQNKINLPKNQI